MRIACLLGSGKRVRGYRRFKSTYRDMRAYYNDELGIVLKKSFILDSSTPKHVRIPTIHLGLGWYVQPKASKVRLAKAYDAVKNKLARYITRKGACPDLHLGNIGWYQRRAVMFDW